MGDGWFAQAWRGDDPEPIGEYMDCKMLNEGYPGLATTTQADVMMAQGGQMAYIEPDKVLKIAECPAVWVQRHSNNEVVYEISNIPNEQAMRIIQDVLPKALELYLKKSKDYGGNVMDRFDLGEKAAIPDMARKFGKLIDAIWRDQPLQYEQPDEILMDLLGHILIILDQRRTDK